MDDTNMNKNISEVEAKEELEKGYDKTKEILENEDKLDVFLQKLEHKIKKIPMAGTTLAMVPSMVSLVRSYTKKEYTEIPLGTIISVISALGYVLSPFDLLPDIIPGVGFADDAAVIAFCLKMVGDDLDDYKKWRKAKGKELVF